MTTSAIVATGLRKSFGDHVEFDGIDLDVPRGHRSSSRTSSSRGRSRTRSVNASTASPGRPSRARPDSAWASAAAWSPSAACWALAAALSRMADAST